MKILFFSFLFVGSITLVFGQSSAKTFQTAPDIRKVKLSNSVLRNLKKNNWLEHKRVYNIRGSQRAYAYDTAVRSLSFEEDGKFMQDNFSGKWKPTKENLLLIDIEAADNNKSGDEQMTQAFFIEKLTRRELILVKALDANFNNYITYYYRRSNATNFGLNNLSESELRQKLKVDLAIDGKQPPMDFESMNQKALVNYAIRYYTSRR